MGRHFPAERIAQSERLRLVGAVDQTDGDAEVEANVRQDRA